MPIGRLDVCEINSLDQTFDRLKNPQKNKIKINFFIVPQFGTAKLYEKITPNGNFNLKSVKT